MAAAAEDTRVRAAAGSRGAALLAFAAFGFLWGTWASLVPAVQQATHASKGELGLALLCVGLGSLPAMLLVGPRIDRVTALLPVSLAALAVAGLLPGLAGSVVVLALSLTLYGGLSGIVDVAINAEVAAIEAASGTRSMQLAHALFSTGLLVGALVGGGLRQAGLSRVSILAVAAAALVTAAVANRRPAPRTGLRPDRRPGDTVSLGLHGAVVGIAAVCACAFMVEGAIENWSALFLTRNHGASPAGSALGPAAYAVAMAAGRFSGQWSTRHASDRLLLAAGGLVSVAGTCLAAASPTIPVAVAAFFLAGAGVSVVAPIAFGAAGRIGGGGAISTVTTIGYLGFLVGPPVMGGLAEAVSLRASFVLLGGLAAAIAAAAFRLRLD